MRAYKQQARIMKALAHPVRLHILQVLEWWEEACVCHLEALLGLRQAYISQQLAVLREAGLVSDRQEGLYVFYRLADERVPALLALTREETTEEARRPPTGPLPNCSCPKCQRSGG